MKAAQDRCEVFYDPARKDDILRRNKTRQALWEEHLKDPIVALDSTKVHGKAVVRPKVGSRLSWKQGGNDPRPSGFRSGSSVVGRGPLALSGCMGQCASTHSLYAVERPREVRAAWRALLLLPFLLREPRVLSELVRFGPSIPVEIVKACVLVGLHMMAEENSGWSENGSSVSSSSSNDNNVGNDARKVEP